MMHNYEFKICRQATARPQPVRNPHLPAPVLPTAAALPAITVAATSRPLTPRALYQDVAERLRQQIAIGRAFSADLLAFTVPDYMSPGDTAAKARLFEQYRRACVESDCIVP